jgi:hypothetical protein
MDDLSFLLRYHCSILLNVSGHFSVGGDGEGDGARKTKKKRPTAGTKTWTDRQAARFVSQRLTSPQLEPPLTFPSFPLHSHDFGHSINNIT